MATLEAEAHTAAAAAATVATAATTTEATNPTISSATTTTEPNAAATAATAAPAGGRRRSPRATTTAGSHRQQPRALKNPQSQRKPRKLVLAKSAAHEVQAKARARAVLESGWRWGGRSAIGQRAPQSPQEEPRTSHLQTHQRPEREQQQQHLGPLNTGLERAAPAEAETKAGEAGAQPPRRQPHPQRQGAKEQVQQQQQLPLPGRPGWQSPRSLGPWAGRARWLLGLGPKAGAWHAGDGSFMMMALLVVVAVVISGNAVLGAQRDSYKAKDGGGGLSGSANAIPNAVGAGSGSAASSGPGPGSVAPAASHGNANGVSNGKTHSSNADGATGADTNASSTATTTTTSSTSATSTAAGTSSTSGGGAIGSGSLLKAGGGGAGGGVGVGVNRNAIEVLEDPRNGPYFDKAASKNVTALLGKTAYLNCRVKNLGNKTMLLQVSWVRHRDIHLLTVGRYTYTSDQRFRAIHQPQTEDWILQIKYPQHRDSGIYECQVSTTPHMSHYIHLNVVEPSTEIIGAPDLYIESGSTINLTCVILNSPEPPAYIFWNHNNAIINYDSPRGGVSVVTNKGETTTSFLLIKSARPSDSGHYQCNPSNAKPKSVTVHVLNGVSHSVSRGVPSSNAARGTGVSSNVAQSLSVGLSVDLVVQLGAGQTLVASALGSQLMRRLRRRLLSGLALLALTALAAARRRWSRHERCCCSCHCLMQQQQQQQQLPRPAARQPEKEAASPAPSTEVCAAAAAVAVSNQSPWLAPDSCRCGRTTRSLPPSPSSRRLLHQYQNECDVR